MFSYPGYPFHLFTSWFPHVSTELQHKLRPSSADLVLASSLTRIPPLSLPPTISQRTAGGMAAGKYWDQPWCPGSGSHKFSRNYQELDGKNRCRMLISYLQQMLSFPFWWCHREWPIASLPMLTMFDTCRYSKCQGLPKIHLHSKLWKVCNHSFFHILCSVLHSWNIYLLTYYIYVYYIIL